MRIGLDLDGVLYPFHECTYRFVVNNFNEAESFSDYWLGFDSKPSIYTNNIINTLVLYDSVDVSPLIKTKLDLLRHGFEFFYITNRPLCTKTVTEKWMRRNRLPNLDNLYLSTSNKLAEVLELNLDFLVDDSASVISTVNNYVNCCLINKVWNLHLDFNPRYNNLLEFLNTLGE